MNSLDNITRYFILGAEILVSLSYLFAIGYIVYSNNPNSTNLIILLTCINISALFILKILYNLV